MHYSEAEATYLNTDTVKGVTGRVAIGKADGADHFCMRVFELSENGYSPRHSHDWEHEIFIHSGNGEVLCDDKWIPVSPGSVIFIPGNEDHQIKNTGDGQLVFVCLIPSGYPEM